MLITEGSLCDYTVKGDESTTLTANVLPQMGISFKIDGHDQNQLLLRFLGNQSHPILYVIGDLKKER